MKIEKAKDIYNFIEKYSSEERYYIFRGVKFDSFQLVPSVGRLKNVIGEKLSLNEEKRLLKLFKHKCFEHIENHLHDDLELLCIAQHHGLPTRLLDWTRNLLMALFFAVEDEFFEQTVLETEYSCVYAYRVPYKVEIDTTFDPFAIKTVKRYVPKHWDRRIMAQDGLFTIHPTPSIAWQPKELEKVLIHYTQRKEIKRYLYKMGVHNATVYSDTDGIAKHIKWLISNIH